MKFICAMLCLLVPAVSLGATISYTGAGTILVIDSEGVPVDETQPLTFSFSFDDEAVDISTDPGIAEYRTGSLIASVGGIQFYTTGRSAIITNDINVGLPMSWSFTTTGRTDQGMFGWFQISLSSGPWDEGLGIVPLSFEQYSSRRFFTGFFADDEGGGRTNFNGTLSELAVSPVPEPATLALLAAPLAGLAWRRRKRN